MDRSALTAVAIAVAAVATAMLAWPSEPQAPPVELIGNVTQRTVTVHVSGAVTRPGLVTLAADARVADAIVAAGGATSNAQLEALNLAAPIGDGARLVVPSPETTVAGTAAGLVRINSANASDLEQLPGVGPVLARRIVTFREDFGPFDAVEDLLGVPGIGEVKLAAIRGSVLVP